MPCLPNCQVVPWEEPPEIKVARFGVQWRGGVRSFGELCWAGGTPTHAMKLHEWGTRICGGHPAYPTVREVDFSYGEASGALLFDDAGWIQRRAGSGFGESGGCGRVGGVWVAVCHSVR